MESSASRFAYASADEAVAHFKTDPQTGLTSSEVTARRARTGANALTPVKNGGLLRSILTQFKSPLVLVLLGAGAVTLFLHEYIDALVICVALVLNVTVGAFQEERASHAFEKLNALERHVVRVIRDGAPKELPVEELVPGDVVELHAGAYVPADLRLLYAKELSINESALTGEWAAVSKSADALTKRVPLAEQSAMAWMGTLVISGYGRGVVVETGDRTQVGLIAKDLHVTDVRRTPLEESIRELARFILYLVAAALGIIFLLGILRDQPVTEMLLLSIAVAVAAMPEGLPAAVTVVLALGMEAILKRGGLVRNLLAAETLGATTVILTDKTGTLTKAQMELAELKTLESLQSNRTVQTDDDRVLLRTAILASDAFIEGDIAGGPAVVRGRPVEAALILAGLDLKISQRELLAECTRLDYLQFASERRYGASLNRTSRKENRLHVTGAPELLIEHAGYVYQGGKRHRFTEELKEQFLAAFKRQSADGMRVIAAGYKDVEWSDIYAVREERGSHALLANLTFMGLMAFSDPVREDVPQAMKLVRSAGARVIMVTGDNPQTAQKIARDAGIVGENPIVYTGDDIESRDDVALYGLLQTAHVFARTLPAQKLRLVRVLKERGEVVAMTGDGVNDAPALQNASIGVAVGSGTAVAKEASDIVLINNSFSIIVAAIEEGRRILDNLKKVVAYLLATSSSEIIVIGSALIIGAPVPFLPTQILWANMIEEGLMSFAFAFEPKERDVMRRDPRSHAVRTVLTAELKKLIIIMCAITGTLLTILYIALLELHFPLEKARTIMFVALSCATIFSAFSLKSLRVPLWRINPFSNRFLLLSLMISLSMLGAALFLPPLRYLLGLVPLEAGEWLMPLAVGFAALIAIEIVKFFVFRHQGAKMTAYGDGPHYYSRGVPRP